MTFIPVIGLIGGVGSGKSTLSRWIAERQRVVIIDGDQIGHQVLEEPRIVTQVKNRFGSSIIDERGVIVRKELGKQVFGDKPEQIKARADLEQIVHPRIREIIQQQIEEARRRTEIDLIILDAAIMLEAGWSDLCDAVIFIESKLEDRLKRVSQSRGWDEATLKRREASQLSLDEKRQRSFSVIHNNNNVLDAGAELEQTIKAIKEDRK